MAESRVQFYNGIKFTRRSDGYFITKLDGHTVLMHRYVWEHEVGVIPKGCVIHHRDENRGNNDISNLECLSNETHSTYHGTHKSEERLQKDIETLARYRSRASAWHRSEEGRAVSRENAKRLIERGILNAPITCTCTNCGKEFIACNTGKKNTFCSNACKSYYRRHVGKDNVTRVCVICGKEFSINKYEPTKTCSRSCAGKLRHMTVVDKKKPHQTKLI